MPSRDTTRNQVSKLHVETGAHGDGKAGCLHMALYRHQNSIKHGVIF